MARRYSDSRGQPFVAVRGRIYLAPLGDAGQKYWLCVSNNVRNRALGEFLAVRLTTSPKPALPSIVALTAADRPLTGRVVCDDLGPIYPDDVQADAGVLTTGTMRRVDMGLRAALALG